jgi:hypothetical protein
MLLHMQHDVKIAIPTAVRAGIAQFGVTNPCAILDACGNFHFLYTLAGGVSWSFAARARISDD